MDSTGGLKKVASCLAVFVAVGCGSGKQPAAPAPLVSVVAPSPVVVPPEPLPLSPRERARLGLEQFKNQQWTESIATLQEAAAQIPSVAPFLRLRIAAAEEARGNARAAAAIAAEIVALGQTSAATVARLRLPAFYAAIGDRPATDGAFTQAMQIPIDELTESDFAALAKDLAKAGRTDLATRLRMRLLSDYTSGRFTEETYGRLGSALDALTLEESMALASKLSRANRYDQALDLLDRTQKRFPDSETRGIYRGIHVRALFNSRNYTTLLEELRDVKLDDPALVLLRARAAWRNDKPQEFLDGLDALEKEFPASREAIEAKVLRARYYSADSVDYAKAIDNLSKAIAAGAPGNDGENLWNLGWTHVLAGKSDEALQIFDRYIRSYPDGDYKTNSLFWSAKVLDRAGRTAERDAKARQLVAEYPFSYYAYRTKDLWPSAGYASSGAGGAFPDLSVERVDTRGVSELLEIGLTRDASREMKVIAAQNPDDDAVQFMLADVYVRGGEPFKANGILQRRYRQFVRHGGSGIPPRFWEILFPLPHLDIIRAEAGKRGLDPYLIASIIRQESGFEPTTVSNAGAVGLMQIMPNEAAAIGAAAGIEGVTRASLFDPATNIAVGAAEITQKLARMNGNETLAIAAYNAGEEAVNRWLSRTPIDDKDVFIESIPYAETRLYVKTVTRNRNEYKRIYP